MDWALLALRVVVGGLFILHGLDKFANTGQFEGWLKALNLPLAKYQAAFASHVEFWGGLAIALGWGGALFPALLVLVMLGAIRIAHWAREPMASKGGWEYALTMLTIQVLFIATGFGTISLDALL